MRSYFYSGNQFCPLVRTSSKNNTFICNLTLDIYQSDYHLLGHLRIPVCLGIDVGQSKPENARPVCGHLALFDAHVLIDTDRSGNSWNNKLSKPNQFILFLRHTMLSSFTRFGLFKYFSDSYRLLNANPLQNDSCLLASLPPFCSDTFVP